MIILRRILTELTQYFVDVGPSLIDVLSGLCSSKHDLARYEYQEYYFAMLESHSVNEASEQFRVITSERFVAGVVEGFKLHRELDVTVCYHILNFEVLCVIIGIER